MRLWALGDSTGSFGDRLEILVRAVSAMSDSAQGAQGVRAAGAAHVADAADHPLPDQAADVWFIDPPYYDAVPYADLSDFFLVWLKRSLPGQVLLRESFDQGDALSPKIREAVQDQTKHADGRPKDQAWFEEAMARSFSEGRRILGENGALDPLSSRTRRRKVGRHFFPGLTRGGWTITGSWPIATEMASRLRARDSAALATSVHLVCRPRPEDAPVGDWAVVLRELPRRVGDWMERLQGEGIRGADLVFACIGPALEIFSRYARVETADGREIGLSAYLEKVWEVVGRTALENVLGAAEARARNGLAGALEEDARLTALFLWTLQATGGGDTQHEDGETEAGGADEERAAGPAEGDAKGFSLVFDVVRRFAQPLGINLPKWENRIVVTAKGVVRLLPSPSGPGSSSGSAGRRRSRRGWNRSLPAARMCCRACSFRTDRRGSRGRPPFGSGARGTAVSATQPTIVRPRLAV